MFIFDYPEITELYGHLLTKLLDESGRGAILIATAHVEEFLTKLLEEAFPKDMSSKQKHRLLAYPGHLSSLSSKIELAYAFRLISKNLYNSLNSFRVIRNNAAHGSEKFKLDDLNEKMKKVFELGENVPYFIKKFSTEMLLEAKMLEVKRIFDEWDAPEEKRKEKLVELFNKSETIAMLEEQLPFWELIHGICIICWMITHEKKKITELTKNLSTWGSLVKEEKTD